jgi:hypothetical protein
MLSDGDIERIREELDRIEAQRLKDDPPKEPENIFWNMLWRFVHWKS